MPKLHKWKDQTLYWKSLPRSATALVFGCVFCLFSAMGMMFGVVNATGETIGRTLVGAAIAGVFAVAWAFAGFRRIIWLLIALFPLQFSANFVANAAWPRTPALGSSVADQAVLLTRLRVEGVMAMVLIVAGYFLLVAFVRREGLRVFGAMTEVRLASEVHRALVPGFSRKIGDYEIYGSSVPAGQVGGDLVDLIETNPRWTAYVADVSGHGVPAGMTMAMFKSAAHMVSPDGRPLANVLGDLNRVFSSLSAPNVFVTLAWIAGGAEGPELTYALAGHLPILHYCKSEGRVKERSVSNLPLAIVPHAEFATASLTCQPGDLLAILTDGLTETADKQERELGLEPLKAAFLQHAALPLAEIADRLRATALERGPQGDDQTVLLVRRSAPPETSRPTA
jgi:hypothetical protein